MDASLGIRAAPASTGSAPASGDERALSDPVAPAQAVTQREKRVTRSSLGGPGVNGQAGSNRASPSEDVAASSYLAANTHVLLTVEALPQLVLNSVTADNYLGFGQDDDAAPARLMLTEAPTYTEIDLTSAYGHSRFPSAPEVDTSDAYYERRHAKLEAAEKKSAAAEKHKLTYEKSRLVLVIEKLTSKLLAVVPGQGGPGEVESKKQLSRLQSRLRQYNHLVPDAPRKSLAASCREATVEELHQREEPTIEDEMARLDTYAKAAPVPRHKKTPKSRASPRASIASTPALAPASLPVPRPVPGPSIHNREALESSASSPHAATCHTRTFVTTSSPIGTAAAIPHSPASALSTVISAVQPVTPALPTVTRAVAVHAVPQTKKVRSTRKYNSFFPASFSTSTIRRRIDNSQNSNTRLAFAFGARLPNMLPLPTYFELRGGGDGSADGNGGDLLEQLVEARLEEGLRNPRISSRPEELYHPALPDTVTSQERRWLWTVPLDPGYIHLFTEEIEHKRGLAVQKRSSSSSGSDDLMMDAVKAEDPMDMEYLPQQDDKVELTAGSRDSHSNISTRPHKNQSNKIGRLRKLSNPEVPELAPPTVAAGPKMTKVKRPLRPASVKGSKESMRKNQRPPRQAKGGIKRSLQSVLGCDENEVDELDEDY